MFALEDPGELECKSLRTIAAESTFNAHGGK
jgi:hypothetical protein